jgi:DNA-binding MarR family transcriptional regulator
MQLNEPCSETIALATTFSGGYVYCVPEDPKYIDAWGYLLRLQAEVIGHIEADLKEQGHISLTWYDVLLSLDNAPDRRLRMSEIADRIVLSRSALTRSVDRLQKEGYLKREPCGHDARGAYAVLTKKGVAAVTQARPVYWAGIKKYFADGLTDSELEVLDSSFSKILTHFKRVKGQGIPS